MQPTNEMTGGEALARMLAAHGVGPMFGMGGFQLLPFYDAVRRLGLRHHLINDERAGAYLDRLERALLPERLRGPLVARVPRCRRSPRRRTRGSCATCRQAAGGAAPSRARASRET